MSKCGWNWWQTFSIALCAKFEAAKYILFTTTINPTEIIYTVISSEACKFWFQSEFFDDFADLVEYGWDLHWTPSSNGKYLTITGRIFLFPRLLQSVERDTKCTSSKHLSACSLTLAQKPLKDQNKFHHILKKCALKCHQKYTYICINGIPFKIASVLVLPHQNFGFSSNILRIDF